MAILVTVVNSSKVLPLQPIAACSYMAILVTGVFPQNSCHCSPFLHDNFIQGCNSSEVLQLQPIAAHSNMAILARSVNRQKSTHCSPFLHGNFSQEVCLKSPPIAAHWSPLLHGSFSHGGYFLKSPPIAAHCSPLLHGNFSQERKSSKVHTLQPILTWQF